MSVVARLSDRFADGLISRLSKTLARTAVVAAVLAVCQVPTASAQHLLDGFNTPLVTRTGYPGDPGAVAVQHDGKIVIAGGMRFDSPWLEPTEHVVRLMVDGAPDPTFGVGFDIGRFGSENVSLHVRSDGRLLLAAVPTGDPARVALLEPDGTDVFIQEAIDGTVHALAEDIDGKTLIAGAFTTVDGQPRNYLARLNADGSPDAGFLATDINGPVTELLRQPDGTLVIAGSFTVVGGQERNRIARLNADGTLDPGFALPTGVNGPINALALQVDGKLVVAGDFSAIGHSARNRIARLNADGSVDAGFDAGGGPDGPVQAIAIRPDGHLVVAGGFLSFDGQARPYRIALLKPNGGLNDAFGLVQSSEPLRAVGVDAPVTGLALQDDGRLLAIGPFAEVDGVARGGLARFNIDGTPDVDVVIEHSNFVAGGNFVNAIHQPDGRMLISGSFDTVHHVGRRGLARLNADGTLDTGFDPGAGPTLAGCVPVEPENCVRTVEMVLQPDGRIIIYGIFDTYDDVPLDYGLARLNADGSLDPTYQPHRLHPIQPFGEGPVIEQAMLQPDGKLIMEGFLQSEADGGTRWLARFNPDGSIDPGFDPYDGFEDDPAYYQVRAERFVLLPDGKLVVKVLGKLCPPCQWTLRNLIRLHPDGSLDEGFFLILQEPLEGDLVNDLHPYLDGSVLVSGTFIRVNGQTVVNLGRFRYDGTSDPGFFFDVEPGSQHGNPSRVYTYGVQADERVVIGTSYHAEIQGLPITAQMQRVLGNGALDFGFDFSPPLGLLTSGSVADASQAADGRWSMVGDLNTYDFTQIPYHNIGRFTTQEPAQQSLHADPGLARIDWLRSGNSPALEHTHFEISLDGETWIDVGRGEPIPGGAGLSPVQSTLPAIKAGPEPQPPSHGGLNQKGALDSRTQFNGEKSAGQPDVPTAQSVGSYPSGIAGRIAGLMQMATLAAVGDTSSARPDATAGQSAQPRNRYMQAAHYTAAASLADLSAAQPSGAGGAQVLVSQVYGGGGSTGAPYTHDFVELFNAGDAPQNLSGWTLQTSQLASSSTWTAVALGNIDLQPGQYYLIQLRGGAEGAPLPTPDATGTNTLSPSTNRVALVASTTVLSGSCPLPNPQIVDFIGMGSTSSLTCFLGSRAPVHSAMLSVTRARNGCWNTGDNGADFYAGPPTPRTSSSPAYDCDAPGPTVTLVSGSPQQTTVTRPFPSPLQIRVTDAGSNPLADVPVTFAVPGGSISAALSATTVLSDADGLASVDATAAGSAGDYTVFAFAEGSAPVRFQLSNTSYLVTPIGGTPQSTPIGTQFPSPLRVRVTDVTGAIAYPDMQLTGQTPNSGASAVLQPSFATTDSNGEASFTATANDVAGNYGVDVFVVESVSSGSAFDLTNTEAGGSVLSIVAVSGSPQTATINEPFAAPLAVRVTNEAGDPVGDAQVVFSAPASGASAGLSGKTVATDANGEASVAATANGVGGTYVVSASIPGASANFELTNVVSGTQVVISQIYRDNSSGSGSQYKNFIELFNAGTEHESLYGWTLQSRNSGGGVHYTTPLPGVALQPGQRLLVGYDEGSASGTLPPVDVVGVGQVREIVVLVSDSSLATGDCPLTNSSIVDLVGVGSVDCFWGNPASRPNGLNGVARNENGCMQTHDNHADFSVTSPLPRNSTAPLTPCDGSGPGAITVSVLDGDDQTTWLNVEFVQPLNVRLTRDGGVPVVGQTVTFLAPASGASAVLSSVTAVTDSNGEAEIDAWANAVVGSYVVRAQVGADGVDFNLTNFGEVTFISFPRQETLINTPFRDIRVLAHAGTSNEGGIRRLPNIPVQFSVPSSGASALLSATTVVTDSNGEAVVRAAANGMPGSYQVTASIAGSAPPVPIDMTNVDPATATQPWDGWSISDVNLPRNRNVWVRARGFTADGSIHESVKVFYPTGGFTATPAAGTGGRIEPPIPQGGDAGDVLSFSIVPDEGFGIASVTGCDGSLNGSTYLTGPLSADCEITASFAGDVETFTVTASAGPGGAIEPDGPQSVTDGQTVSFLLLLEPEHVIAGVDGTCGGELDEDLYTTAPVTADCSVEASFQPEPIDDRLFANGFEEDDSTP